MFKLTHEVIALGIIDLSIRRPVFAWILMSALIIFGAISLSRMGISQMPDVDFPILSVSITYDGAAPEVVESEIIDPIEARLLVIEGVKEMRSSARQGSGTVMLEFDIKRNVDVALQEVQSALSQMKLPTGVEPPIIRKSNPEEDPIMIAAIYSDKPLREMMSWVENSFLDQIRFLPGVGEVSISGFSSRNLRIWVDPDKLRATSLTVTDVLQALQTQHLETAAGQYTEGPRELRVRWLGEAATVEQVENIKILRRGGAIIYDRQFKIKDVARVEDGLADVRRLARVEGKPAIAISIKKQRGTNEVDVASVIRRKFAELKPRFPEGYDYRINVDFTRPTEATVKLTVEKLWVAAAITILVCFLFLGNIQAAINILFSIPTSIVGTFLILYFSGFTLNLFTLLALTLAVSIVVDDAIMLLENIVRHYRMGKGSTLAASDGAKEILPAAAASTFAVIAVFLPVVFMSGIIGKFFFQFGVTMSAAVLLSLLEALTITPMRAAELLRSEPKISRLESWLDTKFESYAHIYQNLLKKTLKRSGIVVILSVAVFAVSLFLITKVRQEFVPSQDQDILIVTAQAPSGASLEVTNEASKKLEALIRKNANVEGLFVSVGAGGPNSSVNQIFMPVTLIPKDSRKYSHTQVMAQLREEFKSIKNLRVTMRDISSRNLATGRQNPVAFNIRGPDLQVLQEKSQEIIKTMQEKGLTVDMDSDYRTGIPELLVVPDREAMAASGVSIEAVAQTLAVAIGGMSQGRFTSEGHRYDIRFKMLDEKMKSKADIENILVQNIYGNLIPLSKLVKFDENSSVQSISRINRQRAISIYGNLAAGKSQSVVLASARQISEKILPTGYVFSLEGASAGFSEAFNSLYFALSIGILVAYMILAIQFNSFVHPISVLIALPFSISGALIALWLSGASLNLFSFIGIIVLMGISKKNSILLVEFTNQIRNRNIKNHSRESVVGALETACPIRLRPILMTSAATIAAAAPLILGGGMGSEARLPMGLTIIGGTIVSTILTLFVVPSLYILLSRLERKQKPNYTGLPLRQKS